MATLKRLSRGMLAKPFRLAVAGCFFCLLAGAAQSQSAISASGQSLKAAYLYKFANYVEWPAETLSGGASPITIGVLNARSLADELATITAGRTIDDRPIVIRQLSSSDSFDGVHILFVGHRDRLQLARDLLSVRSRPVLTVTDAAGALSSGSVINFTVSDDRVRFEVSLAAAEENRLRLNSRLLAVAENVIRSNP